MWLVFSHWRKRRRVWGSVILYARPNHTQLTQVFLAAERSYKLLKRQHGHEKVQNWDQCHISPGDSDCSRSNFSGELAASSRRWVQGLDTRYFQSARLTHSVGQLMIRDFSDQEMDEIDQYWWRTTTVNFDHLFTSQHHLRSGAWSHCDEANGLSGAQYSR